MSEPIENLYFNWLCAKVNRTENPTPFSAYDRLFRQLHNTEFVWILSGDDNRAEDGLELREEFLVETGLPEEVDWKGLGCSIFEMLIAFAKRARFMAGETVSYWFWRFITNLGLDEAHNTNSDFTPQDIDDILNDFVWRNYSPSGHGGLFPMREPPEDQTQVEIWYQFCEYLVDEHWPL